MSADEVVQAEHDVVSCLQADATAVQAELAACTEAEAACLRTLRSPLDTVIMCVEMNVDESKLSARLQRRPSMMRHRRRVYAPSVTPHELDCALAASSRMPRIRLGGKRCTNK